MSKQVAPPETHFEPRVETMLDPELILADDNIRYGLKESRIETLMESIRNLNGVQSALKVTELPSPIDGKLFRVSEGHYRHAAALRLKNDGMPGIEVPCIVVPELTELQRLDRQVSENVDREDMSPMDKARAMQKYMDLGLTRLDIRKRFIVTGGRKGSTISPLSNSMLNIHLSFLTLPKPIQEKIHQGLIPLTGGMKLVKMTPDQRKDVLDEIESSRLAQIEAEEKDETKFLEKEAKEVEAREKLEALSKDIEAAKAAADEAAKLKVAKAEELQAAFKAQQDAKDAEGKKKAKEHFDAVEADAKAAQKKVDEVAKSITKLETAKTKAEETAEKLAASLKASREAVKADKKIGVSDIKEAADKKGVTSTGSVPLTLSEIRGVIADLEKCKDQSPVAYHRVAELGRMLRVCLSGTGTPKSLARNIALYITTEIKEKGKTVVWFDGKVHTIKDEAVAEFVKANPGALVGGQSPKLK